MITNSNFYSSIIQPLNLSMLLLPVRDIIIVWIMFAIYVLLKRRIVHQKYLLWMECSFFTVENLGVPLHCICNALDFNNDVNMISNNNSSSRPKNPMHLKDDIQNVALVEIHTEYTICVNEVIRSRVCCEGFTPIHVSSNEATLIHNIKTALVCIKRYDIHYPNRIIDQGCSKTTYASIHIHYVSIPTSRQRFKYDPIISDSSFP
uniref:Putative methyltransferase PMT18 n=1 Tax=Rhizophora mucronata TaxID=61149 RepID=A0A2P2N8U9_RHIMU